MIALIIGGSSGLGESITRALANNADNQVYFTYNRSADKANAIQAELANATAIQCDISNPADVQSLKEKITTLNIDVLVNNAYTGKFLQTYFHKTPSVDYLTSFRENIIPTIELTQAAINSFRKKKQGKIITILTSALVDVPPTGSSVYVANKAYLEKLTKVWAAENAKFNITSNTVSPSFMLTNFTSDMDERIVEQMTENHPLKRLLTTNEVADAVLFLAGASSHINGIDLLINAATNIK